VSRAARRAALGLALVATGAGVAGCGDDPTGEKAGATKVAAYLGVPLRGPWGQRGLAVTAGAELALDDAKGGAGGFSLRLSERDVTDDDGINVGVAGAAREAGIMLRDSGAVGAIAGVSAISVREYGLMAGQTGIAFVAASGDDQTESGVDLEPRGTRSSVDLSATDAAVRAGVIARVRAAKCRRPVVADARSPVTGSAYDLSALRPVATATAASWDDAKLRSTVSLALRDRRADCIVLTGDPSGGDPDDLMQAIGSRQDGHRLFLSRGAASPAMAERVRARGLDAEAIVDDGVPDATPEGRRIDALYRALYETPAPVGVLAGWRSTKLLLRALANAGPKANRRDGVRAGLLRAAIPGPPAEGRQNPDGTVTTPSLSVAKAEPYGWRAVEALDPADPANPAGR
jgi:hypothetical protein